MAALAAMVFWFARGIIFRGEVPFFRDLSTYFYPLRFVLWQAFQNRELPLWNRHVAMGFPVLADFESAVFYPPHILFSLLGFFTAIRAVYVFHYLTAAIGTYVLFRDWEYPRHQAIVGALLFSFGGTMVSLINLLNHFQSAVWLPWSVFCWCRFLRRNTWPNFLAVLLVLGIQLLAGSPEVYGFTMILLVLSTCTIVLYDIRAVLQSLWWLALVNVLIFLLAAVQLFPTIELFLESRRQEAIPIQEALSWSLNPWRLLNLILLDKTVDLRVGDGTQLFLDRDIPLFVTRYLGAVSLFGISFWAVKSSLKEKVFWSFLVGCFLLLSFGVFTPIYPFLYRQIGLFRTFRYPEKFFFLVHAVLIFGALKGLARFEENGFKNSRRALQPGCCCCGFLLIAYAAARFEPSFLTKFIINQKGVLLPAKLTYGYAASVFVSLERQIALSLALFVVFWAASSGRLQPRLYRFLLVAIVFIDLSWAHESFQYLLKPDRVLSAPKILEAPDREPSRIFYYPSAKNLHAGAFVIKRPPSTAFDRIYQIVASNLLPNSGVPLGFDYMQDINALAKSSYVEFLKYANQLYAERQFRLLAALNVKYVVSFQPLISPGLRLIREFPEYPSWLYTIDGVLPRAYIVSQASVETNSINILRELSTAGFDLKQSVFLADSDGALSGRSASNEARILEYGNQIVTIQADTETPGVLVFTDSFFPGWNVYVDGKAERLLRANYFFRGVNLHPGKHRVEFRYEPYWFRLGAFVSLFSAAVLVIVSTIAIAMRCGWLERQFLHSLAWLVPASRPVLPKWERER